MVSQLGPGHVSPLPQGEFIDDLLRLEKARASPGLDEPCEYFDVEYPFRHERLMKEPAERRCSKKLRAALSIVHRQAQDQGRCRGETASKIVPAWPSLDLSPQQLDPGTHDDFEIAPALRQIDEFEYGSKGRRQIGVPEADVVR